jgi:DNA processing protein
MSAAPKPGADACVACLRRAWLLGVCSARLAYQRRDPERLLRLLELSDEDLVQAIGGRRREELLARHAQFDPADAPAQDGIRRICRHDPRWPRALARRAGTPWMLHAAGDGGRIEELNERPAVAIVGTPKASDYGMEVAHGLARGLAASGITVVSGLAEGIPAAAHLGALEAGGPTVTVTAGGVDVAYPATWRALHRRIVAEGCALAELPRGCPPRGWCHAARARTVAALARLVIVVEAGEEPRELLHARLAAASGTTVAAVPGRVGAPGARGPHLLLREGALLVRDPQDALDALYGVGGRRVCTALPALPPRQRAVLEQVGSGRDTVDKLTAACGGGDTAETLVSLARLELSGAIVRGDGGRYLVRV